MKPTRRDKTAMGAAALACGVLLAMAPGATAATALTTSTGSAGAAPQTRDSVPAPPVLTSVTKDGDNMIVIWVPSSSQGIENYVLLADGRVVEKMFPGTQTGPEDKWFVAVASEGLTGEETFTVAAEDGAGNLSAPSDAMKATAPMTLTPTPQMVSAVVNGDVVTLTWTASHTGEASGDVWYEFFVNGKPYKVVDKPQNVTSSTMPVSDDDPVDPTIFLPGAKVTVEAIDFTGLDHSAIGNAVTVAVG